METENLLPPLKEPNIFPHPEADRLSSRLPNIFIYNVF
jgi:hypothetical protein